MVQTKFGKTVKKARKKIGLTQEELAEKVGIHVSYLSKMERGKEQNPTKELLEKLGKLLKLKPSDMLSL